VLLVLFICKLLLFGGKVILGLKVFSIVKSISHKQPTGLPYSRDHLAELMNDMC
jgi:hypothetical protein